MALKARILTLICFVEFHEHLPHARPWVEACNLKMGDTPHLLALNPESITCCVTLGK